MISEFGALLAALAAAKVDFRVVDDKDWLDVEMLRDVLRRRS